MPDKITFYAITGEGRTIDNPWGMLRRLEFDGDGYADEGLQKDFRWGWTNLIHEWERGDFEDELVEVSHPQVRKIIEYFRQHWPRLAWSWDTVVHDKIAFMPSSGREWSLGSGGGPERQASSMSDDN